jgi:hypothetical protein
MSQPNWHHNQPIVSFLRRWIPICLPQVRTVGGYAGRTTETGGFSAHSEGRAVDVHLNAFDESERLTGDALAQMFVDRATDLGVDHVIWNRRIWSAAHAADGWRAWPADRNPHTNHVHVAFTRQGSQIVPPYLIPLLDGIHISRFGTMAGMP